MIAQQRALGQMMNPFATAGLGTPTVPETNPTIPALKRLRKPRHTRKARGFGDMGDSEDYMQMRMLMGQMQGTGASLNLANGAFMFGDDLYEDGLYNLLAPPVAAAPAPAADDTATTA